MDKIKVYQKIYKDQSLPETLMTSMAWQIPHGVCHVSVSSLKPPVQLQLTSIHFV